MLNFEIKGNDIQTLEIILKPGEIIKSQPGSMIYMQSGIEMEGKIFDNKKGGMLSSIGNVFKRLLSGESLSMVYYKNISNEEKKLGLAPDFLGQIVGFQLKQGENFYLQPGSFLAGTEEIDISIEIVKNVGAGLLGGDGFVLQKIVGPGIIFVNGFGNIQEIELNNETLYVDNDSLVGFSEGIEYSVETVKGVKNIFLSGEGLTNVKLSGTGSVYVQNTSMEKYLKKLGNMLSSFEDSNSDNNLLKGFFD